jgi:hypothetical protein
MLFRVRENVCRQIIFCVLNNNINTQKYTIPKSNQALLLQNTTNFNNLVANSIEYNNNYQPSNVYFKNKENKDDITPSTDHIQVLNNETLANLQYINQYNTEHHLIFDIFKKVNDWGVDKLNCNYLPSIPIETPESICIEVIDDIINSIENSLFTEPSIQSSRETEHNLFYDIPYTNNYDNNNDDDRDIIDKYFALQNYNYSIELWNNANNDDDVNTIDFLYLTFHNDFNSSLFNKLSNISFYNFKEVIVFLFENCFIKKQSLTNYLLNTNSFKHHQDFSKWILGLYICFNTFYLINIDFRLLEELYLNEPNVDNKNKFIKIDKKQFYTLLNTAYENNIWFYKYIMTFNEGLELNFNSFYSFCFQQIGMEFQNYFKYNYFSIQLHKQAFHYRLQQTPILFHEDNDDNDDNDDRHLTINQIDDKYYWLNNNDTINVDYKDLTDDNFKISFLPKIPIFKYENKRRLKDYFRVYGNTNKQDEFDLLFSNINIQKNTINQIKPVKKYDKLFNQTHEEKDKVINNQTKQQKKEETKLKEETTILCDCGGHYWAKDIKRHLSTKKHQSFINK